MLSPWSLFALALAGMAVLFLVAWTGERRPVTRDYPALRGVLYALSLGVYCTSWTFYGAVGSAASTGWGFLPIYLGPILVMWLAFGLLRRIAESSREHRITSIADYIAHRYGRSQALAVMVTVAAVVGAVPYIALQFQGILSAIAVLSGTPEADGAGGMALGLAVALALFTMAFGTRRIDAAEHQRGLIWAIAFESVVKLLAFLALGLFALFGVLGGPGALADRLQTVPEYQALFSPWQLPEGFGIQLVLAMTALLCLPRQFHVAIVEYRGVGELRVARWLFSLYLLVFALFVVPIAVAGLDQFAGTAVNPDHFVLALPMAFGEGGLALLAFIGGFSAATGMVIVSTVALAIMVSNHLVMPLLLRGEWGQHGSPDLPGLMLWVRRGSILFIMLAALLFYRTLEGGLALASIGLLAFAAAAQFAPAMLFGLYWRGASRAGAVSGLAIGAISWFFLLLLPALKTTGEVGAVSGFNDGALLSLLLNSLALVLVSLLLPDVESPAGPAPAGGDLITMGELQATVGRFLGLDTTRRALAAQLGPSALEPGALATPATVQLGERLLSGSIGSASARSVLRSALRRRGMGSEEVLDLLDQTSQAVQFNRELLEATLDNLTQGVSVVDRDLRLVGWNRRYLELMAYPEGTVYLGQPVEALIRLNAERGLIDEYAGVNDEETAIERRLLHLQRGRPYRIERAWIDNTVLEISGNPMPGGGYVTTFTDITHYKAIERALQEVNESLEQRVDSRTRELREAVEAVEAAREEAVEANRSKTRFLAAASHDLLQPMNAARLFISVLRQQEDGDESRARLVMRADRSLTAAEELLSSLLDISRLDSGVFEVNREPLAVAELFEQLRRRFKALAANRGLELRVRAPDCIVYSDRTLLYRILQNFLSNALRYTESGGVLLGARRRGDALELGVWDSGVGMAPAELERVFEEFQRLDYAREKAKAGLGLGLAIADRIARTLDHPLSVSSREGRGSAFMLRVPLSTPGTLPALADQAAAPRDPALLDGQTVLCVDNEADILEGMRLLLERWGCRVLTAGSEAAALKHATAQAPHLLLLDYHLDGATSGIAVLQQLRERGCEAPAIFITADRSQTVESAISATGSALLRKPLRPAALRALASNLLRAQQESQEGD